MLAMGVCRMCTRTMSNFTKSQVARNILRLEDRGLWLNRIPDNCVAMEKDLMTSSQTVYSGFDPTSDSLHIGNLLVLISLIHCQRAGHQPIALIGEATASVGDPSGKKSERDQLAMDVIGANAASIQHCIESIFANHEQLIARRDQMACQQLLPLKVVNNMDWYGDMEAISFFRDVGSRVRMGSLLRRSLLKSRLDANEAFSFTEFTYQVLQAYDWLHLSEKHNCRIQIGGSDQLGNLQAGKDLIAKTNRKDVLGLLMPLLLSDSGEKLGKSANNALWLNAKKTPPHTFYKFFLDVADSQVERLLKLFTFLPLNVIHQIMKFHERHRSVRRAQKRLATEVTKLVHGERGLKSAQSTSSLMKGNNPTALFDMLPEDIVGVVPGTTTSTHVLQTDTSVLDAVVASKLCVNEERALSAIANGRISVNRSRITAPLLVLYDGVHILPSKMTIITLDERKTHVIQWVQ